MSTRTAIRQALHFSHGLTFSQVARMTGSDPSSIRKALSMAGWAARPPHERTEAIDAARDLIKQGGR